MNKRNNAQWVEIDTDSSDETGKNEAFELNLSKDLEDEDDNEFKKDSKDTRRGILTTSDVKTKEAEKDTKTRAEDEEDQEERETRQGSTRLEEDEENQQPKKEGRAHKRIKTLLGRLNEKDQYIQELEARFRQVATKGRQAEQQSITVQAEQWKELVEAKKNALEEAVNKSDGKEIARLSQEIADATMKYNAFEAAKEDYEDTEEDPKEIQQTRQKVEVPEAAKDWVKRNTWFKTDPKRHVIARMISQELTNEGELDPHDEEYWEELDNRMKKTIKMEEKEEKPKKKGSPVGSRNDEDSEARVQSDKQFSRIGNKVQASPTTEDYDMAERLGVDIKGFMKEKYKYAQQDYKGYVNIDIPGQN